MKTHFTMIRSIALFLLSALSLAGCAHQAPTRSGFLGDYSGLHATSESANEETAHSSEQLTFGAVHIEPVRYVSTNAGTPLAPEDSEPLCRVLEEALKREFANLPQATVTSSRTMRIRAAITGVDRSYPLLNLLTTLAIFVPVDNGGVSVEIEAVDESTGSRVAALSGARNGSLFDLLQFFRSYGHAETGLHQLAVEFRRLVAAGPAPMDRAVRN